MTETMHFARFLRALPGFTLAALRNVWRIVRTVSGDDAYERYLAHWRRQHASDSAEPLDRAGYFRAEQARKWNSVRRCC